MNEERSDDPFADLTVGNTIREAAQFADADDADAGLVLLLWNRDGRYDVSFLSSNLTCSQAIALLEIQKQRLVQEMNRKGDAPSFPS